MILKLGMKHQAMELYKVCINHDPGMTLTFLQQGQLRLSMHLNGEICYWDLQGYIYFFLIFIPKHRLWVLVRTASTRRF